MNSPNLAYPFPAGRSILGRWSVVSLDGLRVSGLTDIQYSTAGREGTGSSPGRGFLVVDKLNSSWDILFSGKESQRKGHTLELILEDPDMPNSERTWLTGVTFTELRNSRPLKSLVSQQVEFIFADQRLATRVIEETNSRYAKSSWEYANWNKLDETLD